MKALSKNFLLSCLKFDMEIEMKFSKPIAREYNCATLRHAISHQTKNK